MNNPESEYKDTELSSNTGEILRKLRNERGLKVQEIASKMRLNPKIIEALEANQFETLPTATYTRGYLRSYAKLVGADADSIISMYNDKAGAPPEIIPDVRHSTQVSSSDKPVKAFSYLVSFILVLLLLTWWWQSSFIVKKEVAVNSISETQSTTANTILDQTADYENLSETQEITDINITEPEVSNDLEDTYFPAVEELPEKLTLENESQENTLSLSADDKLKSAEAITGPDTLVLKMTADSWIEIYDAYGNERYLDLARTGEEIALNGTTPFSVKLGFSQGVTVKFNNQLFDHAPFSRGGVARFTLGE